MKNIIDVNERLPILKTIPLSLQHLFAMVGATILVPMITGLSPSIALFCSGVGTLLYILFTKDPGLHRSILGDGIATMFAGFVGGPPNTTYGENIGVMAITKVYSVWVIGGAAIIAIILSFIGPVSEVIGNIPLPVIGGVSVMLFGIIASSGFRIFVEDKIDFSKNRNLIIASVIIVLGIGGGGINFHFLGVSVDIAGLA